MANEYKFPKVFQVNTNNLFFNGEQPSPAKFTGIFKYITSAFFSIENFLGNGIDYNVTGDNHNRFSILNLSTAIGHMSSVAIPINKVSTLFNITYGFTFTDRNDILNKAVYDSTTKSISVLSNFSIPIGKAFENDTYFCINFSAKYTTSSTLNVGYTTDVTGNGPTGISTYIQMPVVTTSVVHATLDNSHNDKSNHVLKYSSLKIPAGTYIEALYFNKGDATSFNLFSIALVEDNSSENNGLFFSLDNFKSSDDDEFVMPLNIMYSIDMNAQGYNCKTRCAHTNICSQSMYNGSAHYGYCIGNTYDYYVNNSTNVESKNGSCVCAGEIFLNYGTNSVDPSILPKDGNGEDIYYAADTNLPKIVSFQSPLYSPDKNGALRMHPVLIFPDYEGYPIGANLNGIYDKLSTVSSIITDVMLYSGDRKDNAFVSDINGIINTTSTNRYYIIGGKFGIADMISKLSENNTVRNVAVYAE